MEGIGQRMDGLKKPLQVSAVSIGDGVGFMAEHPVSVGSGQPVRVVAVLAVQAG
jgi:hypothetical protein